MFLVDTHCHLDMLDLSADEGDLNKVLMRAQKNAVHYFLNVCVTLSTFPSVLQIAERYPYVGASVGLHPNEEGDVDSETLAALGKHPKVLAVGETGLDYFRSEGDLEWQRERFRTHIKAAKMLQKPLIVHTRAAKKDTIDILREESASEVGGIMHCFTEDWPMAKAALDLNFDISFSGIVTFKNAVAIQEVAKRVPLDRLMIETDAPYLAPEPHRGKSNEPGFVHYTAAYLAKLRGISLEDFAEQSTQNFFRLMKGAVRPDV